MIKMKIYVNNYGWILGRDKQGKLHYTHFAEGAKEWSSEMDKDFISYARQAEHEGHHIDKVRFYEDYDE